MSDCLNLFANVKGWIRLPISKEKSKTLLIVAVLGLMLLAALGGGVWYFLPCYIEYRLIPQLARQYGLNPAQVQVQRIGLNGSRLGPIRLDAAGRPLLAVRAIDIDYSPFTLMRGCIDKITIIGFEAQLAYTSEGIRLSGLPRRTVSISGEMEKTEPRPLEKLLPVELNAVVIQQARSTVHWNNHTILVPFELSLNTSGLKNGVLTGSGRLTPWDSVVHIRIALQSGQAEIIFDKSHLKMDRFTDLLDDRVPFTLAGHVDLNGRTTLRVHPMEITGLSISTRLSAFKLSSPDLQVENMPVPGHSTSSTLVELNMDEKKHIQWQCAPFQLTSPAKIQVAALTGNLDPTADGWQFKARARTDIPAQPIGLGRKPVIRLEKNITLTEDIHGRYSPDGGIEFEVSAAADSLKRPDDILLKLGAGKVHSQTPQIELTATYKNKIFNTWFNVTTRDTRVDLPDGRLDCPQWSLEGDAAISSAVSIQAQARLSDTALAFASTLVKMPEAVLRVQARKNRSNPFSFEGDLHMAGVRIDDPRHRIKVRDLSGHIPLAWPQPPKGPPGKITAPSIQWQSHQLGGLEGTLSQRSTGLLAEIQHRSKLFPGMIVFFTMKTDRTGTALTFQVPAYQPKDDLDLGLLSSSTAGFMANGRVQAKGGLFFKGTSIRSHARVQMDNGRLQQKGLDLDFSGIFLDLHLNDLTALSSPPGQRFHIDNLHYGRLNAARFNVDFQIDAGPSVFIQKAGLDWCQGTIHTPPFRITPGVETFDMILACDALNLAMMLEQLKVAEASGQGTVSGRIPLRWTKGRLQFRDGFLSSLPGESGAIRISGTDYLLAGLPPDAPQRTQLEIAIEALKDYTFKWARLHLNSQQDDLLVQLQVDGKPNRLLPFVFDTQLGRLKRIPGQGQADFKGIRIDLNFKSPMNEILQYKELLTPKLR